MRPSTFTRNPCYTDPVANLTITIDDELLRSARVKAAEQGTSVNAVLRDELIRYAGQGRGGSPVSAFLEVARSRSGSSGAGGRDWTREDLHMERFEPHETEGGRGGR